MPVLLRAALLAAFLSLPVSAYAEAPPADLWSLYLREHTAAICGRALTEHDETELDEAQHEARQRMRLTPQEAAKLYRQAGAVALSNRSMLCKNDSVGGPLADSQIRAEWSSGR